MEMEHSIREDGEEVRQFLLGIKKTVGEGWPSDMEGRAPGNHVDKKQLRHGKDDKEFLCTHWKDLEVDIFIEKDQNIW